MTALAFAMETRTTIVLTPEGRELCSESGGDPSGRAIFVHHGTPSSRHLYRPDLSDAEERGVHSISYDRPGYGGQLLSRDDV